MNTRTAPSGVLFLDGAGFVSTQAVANACALDYVYGFSFYEGGRYGTTPEQHKIAEDHGKDWSPNWERRGDEARYGAGTWVVDSIRQSADFFGIDCAKVPTYVSGVDFYATQAEWAQLDYWHQTLIDRAVATNVWVEFYGMTGYLKHLIAQDWCPFKRPWTWGGSGELVEQAAKQHYGFPSGNDYSSVGVTVDESHSNGILMVTSHDVPPEETMGVPIIVSVTGSWAKFLSPTWPLYTVNWIGGPERAAAYEALPHEAHEVSQEQLQYCVLEGRMPINDQIGWGVHNFWEWIPGSEHTEPPPSSTLIPHVHNQLAQTGPAVAT